MTRFRQLAYKHITTCFQIYCIYTITTIHSMQHSKYILEIPWVNLSAFTQDTVNLKFRSLMYCTIKLLLHWRLRSYLSLILLIIISYLITIHTTHDFHSVIFSFKCHRCVIFILWWKKQRHFHKFVQVKSKRNTFIRPKLLFHRQCKWNLVTSNFTLKISWILNIYQNFICKFI